MSLYEDLPLTDLDKKAREVFGDHVVVKSLAQQAALHGLPRYVSEYLIAKYVHPDTWHDDLARVQAKIKELLPDLDHREYVKDHLLRTGETTLIDYIEARVDLRNGQRWCQALCRDCGDRRDRRRDGQRGGASHAGRPHREQHQACRGKSPCRADERGHADIDIGRRERMRLAQFQQALEGRLGMDLGVVALEKGALDALQVLVLPVDLEAAGDRVHEALVPLEHFGRSADTARGQEGSLDGAEGGERVGEPLPLREHTGARHA